MVRNTVAPLSALVTVTTAIDAGGDIRAPGSAVADGIRTLAQAGIDTGGGGAVGVGRRVAAAGSQPQISDVSAIPMSVMPQRSVSGDGLTARVGEVGVAERLGTASQRLEGSEVVQSAMMPPSSGLRAAMNRHRPSVVPGAGSHARRPEEELRQPFGV
ncbi:MAG: hypothetical protein ACYDAC_11045 [Candidatus Dormibacteria bacterium]